ncbi:FliH/SctL family protein [Cellulomonas sp. PhB150]|uniref:FliH/SctL family protein n=1 Tax=Cellulomonas sp. PhB150 TaxID=2485188 RepID=UPI000F49E5E8|nr:FliH/SctL family protein [Cellulomonas sp. PhB150]ROS25783.1 flagellar assembly protein FliH [Cellulomonas sp. PhB150]
MPDFRSAPVEPVRAFHPAALGSTAARDEAYEDARSAGFAAGYAAGARRAAQEADAQAARVVRAAAADAEDAARQVAEVLVALDRAAAAVRAIVAPVLADATLALHEGALTLAEAVLGVELADDERSASAALARVRAAEPGPGPVTVRLHPRDLAALLTSDADVTDLRLEADAGLAPGDAVAEHAEGHLDARVGAALGRARAALTDAGDGR